MPNFMVATINYAKREQPAKCICLLKKQYENTLLLFVFTIGIYIP